MKKLLYILFLLFPPFVYAQEKTNPDSLQEQGIKRLTSITDSLQILQVADSLQQLNSVVDTLKIQHKLDSLRKLSSSLDTLKLKQLLDSIQNASLPTEAFQAKADSIKGLLDMSAKANQKIGELDQQLNQSLQEKQQKLQQKVGKLAKLEDVNQQALGNLKEQTGVDISTDLPRVEGIPMEGVKEIGVPDIDVPAGELSFANLPKLDLPKAELPEVEGLDQLQEAVGKVGEVSEKVDGYSEDISNVAEGKLDKVQNADKLAEQELMNREEISLFQQQQGEAFQGAKQFQQLKGDKYLKQKATEEAAKVAVDHFAGHKDKLNAARAKLMKYKGRYSEIKSVKDLPKNPLKRNPLKGKPWPERIVVGSIWNFSKGDDFKMDVGPSIAYRIYDKAEVGATYQWRLTVDKQADLFLSTRDQLHGYSLFFDYKFKKGFFARGTYAKLYALPQKKTPSFEEEQQRKWVNSFEVGLGRSYTFYKGIKGYSLIQYSFSKGLDKPYPNPIQMKIGFYINGKHFRKPKKKE
jgi:hypothetical protein